jgi:hypothetical protein
MFNLGRDEIAGCGCSQVLFSPWAVKIRIFYVSIFSRFSGLDVVG